MSYVVKCDDHDSVYGPFDNEEEAHRYAGLFDIDPGCRDVSHEVEWSLGVRAPEPYEVLRQAVMGRIQKYALAGPACRSCGQTLGKACLPGGYCSTYCEPSEDTA